MGFYTYYDKKYNTSMIRAIFLMFITMFDSNEIDYDLFYDYTGLSSFSYRFVRKTINEMINDLNLKCSYRIVKYPRENRYTKYYIYKYTIDRYDKCDYSYDISSNLSYEKRINYSMCILFRIRNFNIF